MALYELNRTQCNMPKCTVHSKTDK